MSRSYLAGMLLLLGLSPVAADTISFGPGRSMDCTVLQDDGRTVTVLHNASLLRFPRSDVEVVKDTTADRGERSSTSASRLPNYAATIVRLAAQEWATELRQIPATVIDTGVMRNVPYKSHRAGGDYEMNVYGDPANPAGIEIGVRGKLLDDEQAKKNCVEFVVSLLSNPDDKAIVRGLKVAKDLIVRDGLTFEITPSTAEDAYGGWWVSVYGEAELDKVRASDKELKAITVSKEAVAETKMVATKPVSNNDEQLGQWSGDDLRYARSSNSKSGGGSVYVRGYTRKDGTYVQSHTRSSPRSR
jgi:hypothetical protein